MNTTIRNRTQAYEAADQLNNSMNIGSTVTIANVTITKIEDCEFTLTGESVNPYSNKYVTCELADFIIWPNRKAWNKELKVANK